jgi:ATP-dependent helicase/nuclease subunit A
MRVLSDAAAECRRERRERGKLDFADLLMIAAELLRTRRDARESLGRRYRHLLVDEFQDTDPVQAEVCLLLASDPSEGNDWRTVRPRPGSLFVVGDPKQSIYRFRRADIETYEFVKQRLAASGEVHLLTHNFRSTKPIEEFVNARFSGVFRRSDPADTVPPHAGNGAASPDVHHAEDAPGSIAGATQAMFAPMHTSRPAGASDGVYRYIIDPGQPRPKKELTAAVDASVLASWIAMRLAGGRSARDFLVLTSARDELRRIAAELAARRIAVDVSGAKINMDLELRELIVVLQALSDPENPVAVVAALEGLFFGCNHEELFAARECGVRFTISGEPGDRCPEPVRGALLRLREWWMATHREPSAIVIDRILTESGLLAWTTGRELGDRRAGMLLQLVDTLRDGTIRGTSDGSMRGVIDRLEALLESEEREPSLRPGRDDAVRVLNVHRAKGLEAPVVVLAAPVTSWNHAPSLAIRRDAAAGGGARIGGMRIVRKQGRSETILAQPPGWDAMSAREERLEQEERERILYVACTRAGEELVVSCALPSGNGSRWAPLMPALDDLATNLDLAATAAPGREIMTRTAASMREEIARVDARRTLAAAPGYALARVTDLAKRELPVHEGQRGRVRTPSDSPGLAWGRAVHAMLDRMVRGDAAADLEVMLRAIVDREWPLETADVRDAHRHGLVALGERVRQSGLWARIAACSRRHTEWPVAHVEHDSAGVPLLIEGVVDLAAFDGTRWLVVDWKSDTVPDDEWFARLPSYKAQVERYAAMIAARTGAGAEGIVVRLDWSPAVDQARR